MSKILRRVCGSGVTIPCWDICETEPDTEELTQEGWTLVKKGELSDKYTWVYLYKNQNGTILEYIIME